MSANVRADTPTSGTIVSVQYLRALAALAVVVFHVTRAVGPGNEWPLNIGSYGVDLFFVISGLIMWITTYGRGMSPRSFLSRRARRIVPLYWVLTVFAVVLSVAVPSYGGDFTSVTHVLASFAFIATENPVTGTMDPVILPGWTLNYEVMFYLVFAVFLVCRPTLRLAGILLVLLGVAALAVLPVDSATFDFYTQNVILEFALGIGIGAAYTAGRGLSPSATTACFAVGALGLIAVDWTPGPRFLAVGVPAALIVAGAALSELRRPWPVVRSGLLLGDASYALYLAHPFVVFALLQPALRNALPVGVLIAFGLAASVAAGLAVHLWIERPLARQLRRRGATPSVAADPAAPDDGASLSAVGKG